MEFIIAISVPAVIFGGMAIIATPFEWFFTRTKKGKKILMALYKAIKEGRI